MTLAAWVVDRVVGERRIPSPPVPPTLARAGWSVEELGEGTDGDGDDDGGVAEEPGEFGGVVDADDGEGEEVAEEGPEGLAAGTAVGAGGFEGAAAAGAAAEVEGGGVFAAAFAGRNLVVVEAPALGPRRVGEAAERRDAAGGGEAAHGGRYGRGGSGCCGKMRGWV